MADIQTLDSDAKTRCESGGVREARGGSSRAEIDTSAPFESVKEAISRFGGVGHWKPSHRESADSESEEEADMEKLVEPTAQLEKDLILKERETLDVLKELESTKQTVEELKTKLQNEASELETVLVSNMVDRNVDPTAGEAEKENHFGNPNLASAPPCKILMELKQAKLNLTKTTTGLIDIRASVELLNRKLERERISLEKTRKRFTQNSLKISLREEELGQTRTELQIAKDMEAWGRSDAPTDLTNELHRLSSEAEQFKKLGEAARVEVQRAVLEIKETKTRIKAAEARLIEAKKMEKAARATKAVALTEIKALSNTQMEPMQKPREVSLAYEQYSALVSKAREAEEKSSNRLVDAMLLVEGADMSKVDILKRVEEATEQVKTSKKELEEALNRVEAANREKLTLEETFLKWRSDHGCRRQSLHNYTNFKDSFPSHCRRGSHLVDLNILNRSTDQPAPVLKQTLSIGQILSHKLFLSKNFETGKLATKDPVKCKLTLGQMLGKQCGDFPATKKSERHRKHNKQQLPLKRRKFGLTPFSLLLAKQSKKKRAVYDLR